MDVRDGKKKRTFDTSDRVSTGKLLVLILRHNPSVVGVDVNEHGWASVDEILDRLSISMDFLLDVVRLDEKGRFSFSDAMAFIRANQGHSIDVDVDLEEALPPSVLYHGTGEKFVESIEREGLIPKSRLYVHLSTSFLAAVSVGSRHGRPVVFIVDCDSMRKDGIPFWISKNGVWLTKRVDVKYIQKISAPVVEAENQAFPDQS